MTYGTLDDELSLVLSGQGIYWSHPTYQDDNGEIPADGVRPVLISVVCDGSLDQSFEIDEHESAGYVAIVDALFEHISTRSYADGMFITVDAHENGDCLYKRETDEA